MALNGFSPADILKMRGSRYFVRWSTELRREEGAPPRIVVTGWGIYDRVTEAYVYEHEDRQVVENMYKLLREEDNNVRGT